MRKAIFLSFLLSFAVLAGASVGRAQITAVKERPSLSDAITEALKNNPEIQAAKRKIESARAMAGQAGYLEDPEIYTTAWAQRAWAEENPKVGENIYQENCAACHGDKGDGKGPQVDRLSTKPRNFTSGIYKFRTTPPGSLPSDQDLFRTVTRGVRGTSMLAQLQLSEQERWAVIQYIKAFSKRFEEEKPGQPIAISSAPSANPKLVTVGKAKYEEAGCAQCHGASGKGDGPSAKGLKDDWGNPITPSDLTLKPFKSGPNPEDLYRTISTGLNGTPMPSYADAFSPNDRWALVSYILSIATHERPRGMMGLVGEEVEGMRIDMRAAMAGMMGGRGMMRGGGGMMNRDMREKMKDMMER